MDAGAVQAGTVGAGPERDRRTAAGGKLVVDGSGVSALGRHRVACAHGARPAGRQGRGVAGGGNVEAAGRGGRERPVGCDGGGWWVGSGERADTRRRQEARRGEVQALPVAIEPPAAPAPLGPAMVVAPAAVVAPWPKAPEFCSDTAKLCSTRASMVVALHWTHNDLSQR